MLAFTTKCSVVTTDCMNALQRILEHAKYHVATVKLFSQFLLKFYFIMVVYLCMCMGLHCRLQHAHGNQRITWGESEAPPTPFTMWDLGIKLMSSGWAASSKRLYQWAILIAL